MNRQKRTYLDRLKAVPGIAQAFSVTMKAALLGSRKEDGETDEVSKHSLVMIPHIP